MKLFEPEDQINRQLKDYSMENIPDALRWEHVSAGILAGVAQRKRRRRAVLWLRWSAGTVVAILGVLWLVPRPVELGAFPVRWMSAAGVGSDNEDSSCVTIPIIESNIFAKVDADNQNITRFEKTNKNKQPATDVLKQHTLGPTATTTSSLPTLSSAIAEHGRMIELLSLKEFTTTELATTPLPTLPLTILEKISKEDSLSLPAPVQPRPRAHWQMEMSGSTNYFEPNYQSVEPGAATPAAYEMPLLGWQAGIRIQRHFNKNWRLGFGLQWQTLRYRANFDRREMVNLYRPGTIDTIFVNQFTGEETYLYRDSVPGVRTRRFQHYNRHTAWQVPLLLGYGINSKRWGVALQVGLNVQLHSRSYGKTLLATGPTQDLAEGDFYNFAFRHSYLVETQGHYQLSPRTSVFTRIGWEQHSKNWLQPHTGAIQRPTVWYLGTGLSWDFR